jgi:hypothetical protein
MFIAMNRFHVIKGCESDFEHVWLSRESYRRILVTEGVRRQRLELAI